MAAYQPKLQAQLNGSRTAGEDCVVRASSTGVDWATKGAKVPAVSDFRKRARNASTGLNTEEAHRGLRSYDTPAELGGFSDIVAHRYLRQPKAELRERVKAGRFVVLWMSYAVLNDTRPNLSGDPRFRGAHAIGVLGQRVREGTVEWRVWDSLADGRRKGIAEGPDWWPRWLVEATAAGFTKSADTWTGVSIAASRDVSSR